MANQNFKVKKGLEVGTGTTVSSDGINVTGVITATSFTGDGSGITGVTAEGTGVSIRDEGSLVGTAATINFIGGNVVAVQNGAITDVTVSTGGLSNVVEDTTPQLGGNLDLNSKNISGTGNIDITGYAAVSGVATFAQNVTFQTAASFGDNDKINVGTGNDLQIFHDGTSSIIKDEVGVGISLVGNTKVVGVLTATSFSGSLATTDLTGTITNAQLAGSIANSKLANDSVSLGGVSVDLGASDATPAFDLQDATNLPTTSLTGTITNAQLAGSIADGKLASTFLKNVVEDTTPQLGGNLDVNGKDTTGTGNINLTGIVTATSFSGSGANLTALTGANAGTYGASAATPIITVDSDGRITGIATVPTSGAGEGSFNNVVEDTTPQLGGNLDLNSKTINGTGNIDITGYAAVSGVSTFSGVAGFSSHITLSDYAEIQIGSATGGDLKIYHDASHSYISDEGTGNLKFRSNAFKFTNVLENKTSMVVTPPGAVELYFDNGKKLETTTGGVIVTGILTATSYIKASNSGGFLKADGTEDTSTYLTSYTETDPIVGAINGIVKANGSGGISTAVAGTDYLTPTGDGSGLTGIAGTAFSNVQASWSVTASGSSAYRFTGPGQDASDNNPDLYLVRGQRYRFTNNSGGSHPFQIRVSNGGSAYNTGVTNNGAASGDIDFNVQWDAPARLFYQCTAHSGMVGNIYLVGGPQVISGIVTATGFSGSGASLTNVDATTLDSIDSGSFLRSDATDSCSGEITFTNKVIVDHNSSTMFEIKPTNGGPWAMGITRDDLGESRVFTHNPSSSLGWIFEHNPWWYNGGSFAKILTTADEGSGNGIDADTLDGVEGASYLRSDADDTATRLTLSPSGFVSGIVAHASLNISSMGSAETRAIDIDGAWATNENKSITFSHGTSGTDIVGQINCLYNGTGSELRWGKFYHGQNTTGFPMILRSTGTTTADLFVNGNTVWHAGNDGAGSGLDADTLDGVQGSSYMSLTGSYWNANNWIQFSSSHGLYWPNNYSYHVYLSNQYLYIRNNNTSNGIIVATNNGTTRGYFYADSSNQIGLLNNAGSWGFKMDSSGNCTATGNVTAYSDARIKENVRTVDDALEKVKSMRGVYFDRKDTGKASVGVIAQEIEEILPEVVETTDTRTEEDPDALEDLKTVSYGNIVGVLIEAIKDQQKQIDELKAKLEEK